MNIKHKIALSALATTSILLLAACGNTASTNRPIQFAIPSNINTLDSTLATDVYSQELIGNVEEGLTRTGTDNKPQLALAKSIDVSKDGLTYTITLKPNLKYSNGTSLTASDFVYSFQRANDPKTGAQYAYLFNGVVKNATEIQAGKLPVNTLGIKAINAQTLVISLVKPTPYFEFLLSEPITFPLNQSFVEKEGKNYGINSANTLYNGPYQFATGSKAYNGSNNTYSILKNNNYYDASNVHAKEIDFQVINNLNTGAELFKEGKLDFAMIDDSNLIKANQKVKGYTVVRPAETQFIQYNQTGTNKALANANIREALNFATNRQELVAASSPASKVATSIVPTGLSTTANNEDYATYAKQGYTYNPAKAKILFEKGLKEINQKTVNLTLESVSDNATFGTGAVSYLQSALQNALPGLTISQKLVPFQQELKDLSLHNFDMAISSWGADYAEPTTFYNLFTTGSQGNQGGFSNVAFDKAFKAATTAPDVLNPAARDKDYKAAETALYDQSNVNPLSFGSIPTLINPNLKGMQIHSSGIPFDLKNMILK